MIQRAHLLFIFCHCNHSSTMSSIDKTKPKNAKYLSWKDKKNWALLKRLIEWRQNNFDVSLMESELRSRNIEIRKKTLKPELAELLRVALETELQHLPLYLFVIRDEMIEALESGRNKDGYNKKAIAQRLKSRGVKVPKNKYDMKKRLIDVYQAEKEEFIKKAKLALLPKTKQPADVGKPVNTAAQAELMPSTESTRHVAKVMFNSFYAKQHNQFTTQLDQKPFPLIVTPGTAPSSTAPTAASKVSLPSMTLTPEQRARMEANRLRALQQQKSTITTLTAEQKARMEANRLRALEVRRHKQGV